MKKTAHGLGVTIKGKDVLLYNHYFERGRTKLQSQVSSDGFTFTGSESVPKISYPSGKNERLSNISNLRISKITDDTFVLAYLLENLKKTKLSFAVSKNLIDWQKKGDSIKINETGMVVPEYKFENKYLLIFGENRFKIAYSEDLISWNISEKPILRFPKTSTVNHKVKVGNLTTSDDGILMSYFFWEENGNNQAKNFGIKLLLLDKQNPGKIIWKSQKSIWEEPEGWGVKNVTPLGIVSLDGELISYWEIEGEGIYSIKHYPFVPSGE